MRPRSKSKLTWLVGALVALQGLILAAGIAGIALVDIGRAYIAGESHYAKAHKEAAYALERYVATGDQSYYHAFRAALEVPKAFGLARIILEHPALEPRYAEKALVTAGLHRGDAGSAIWLYRTLSVLPALDGLRAAWARADRLIGELENAGLAAQARLSGTQTVEAPARARLRARVAGLNAALSVHLRQVSTEIGALTRTVERAVIAGMCVLTGVLAIAGILLGRQTARRLAAGERELIAGQARLRDIADTAADWFWELDRRLRFTYVSPRFTEVTGLPAASVVGYAPWHVFGSDGDSGWRRVFAALRAGDAFQGLEVAATGADGTTYMLRLSGRPYCDADGRVAGYRGTASDVTAEVTARRTAERRREILEATFDSMADGVVAFDPDWRVLAANERYCALLDVPQEMVRPGAALEDLVRFCARRGDYGPGDVGELTRRRLHELWSGPRESELFDHQSSRTLAVRSTPLSRGGAVFTYADVTERQRKARELAEAKEQAELASRAKSEFLANVSHELRTPLNAVIGFSEVMADGVFGPIDQRYQQYARDIHDSGMHLLELINDILDLSRVEAGQLELQEDELDLPAMVGSAMRIVRERAKKRGLTLVDRVPDTAPRVFADPKRLKQMLVNLLANAVKFSNPRGEVAVEAAWTEQGLALSVIDSGVGIPADDLERVFRPFHQADSGLARNQDGVGLGLSLVRHLARLHGGEVGIDSAVGEGTRVTMHLPAWRLVGPPTAALAETGTGSG